MGLSARVGQRALSEREHEVLALLADGLSLREVSNELVLSPRTVGTHVEQIYDKLGARTRAHAVGIAFRGGLLEA
jgi:DNA-binding NarL/FixJ family response regulator